MHVFRKFVFREFVFAAVLGLIVFVLFQTVLKEYYLPVFWVLLATIAVLTGFLHYSILQVSQKEVSKFTSRFMMVMGMKMMIYLHSFFEQFLQ